MYREEYIKEKIIKDKSDEEKQIELINSIIRSKKELEVAVENFQFAEGDLIDYYLYQIKAIQSKLDFLLREAKVKEIQVELMMAFYAKNRQVV